MKNCYAHPLRRGLPYPITTVLRDLASQENCDGEPYDVMIAAADEIDRLNGEIRALEEKYGLKFIRSRD